jgi:antitoxin component of RelBE/YafQ-DinJ toxin-antitoxin module
MLNIKTDTKLKKAAQAQAARLGLSLSAILNNYLRMFVVERSVTFEEPLIPNEKTAKELDEALRDIKEGKNLIHFDTNEEMDEYLRAL